LKILESWTAFIFGASQVSAQNLEKKEEQGTETEHCNIETWLEYKDMTQLFLCLLTDEPLTAALFHRFLLCRHAAARLETSQAGAGGRAALSGSI
jgi:hypothetical protein